MQEDEPAMVLTDVGEPGGFVDKSQAFDTLGTNYAIVVVYAGYSFDDVSRVSSGECVVVVIANIGFQGFNRVFAGRPKYGIDAGPGRGLCRVLAVYPNDFFEVVVRQKNLVLFDTEEIAYLSEIVTRGNRFAAQVLVELLSIDRRATTYLRNRLIVIA